MNDNISNQPVVQAYLAKIKANLSSMAPEEVDEILYNVREHIETELENRGGEPSAISAILAEMDPPESYSIQENNSQGVVTPGKTSRKAIYGAIALPFGALLILLFLPVSVQIVQSLDGPQAATAAQPKLWQIIARFTVLPVGIIAPFLATTLGLAGISEIRSSHGKIIGLPLAVFVSLFYPVIVLDSVLFILATALFGLQPWWNIAAPIVVLVILLVDYIILRQVWKTVSNPSSTT